MEPPKRLVDLPGGRDQLEYQRAQKQREPLIREATRARASLRHVERCASGEIAEYGGLEGALSRLTRRGESEATSPMRLFSREREAGAAARRNLPRIRQEIGPDLFPDAGNDSSRVADVRQLELLREVVDRAVGNANAHASANAAEAKLRELMRTGPETPDVSDKEELLRLVYELSDEERALLERRAKHPRNDEAPHSGAERAKLHRMRGELREQFEARVRRVT